MKVSARFSSTRVPGSITVRFGVAVQGRAGEKVGFVLEGIERPFEGNLPVGIVLPGPAILAAQNALAFVRGAREEVICDVRAIDV